MRFSLWCDNNQPWDVLLEEVTHAEQSGWEGVWLSDHFLPMGSGLEKSPHDVWALLAALAVSVPRVRLGTLVCGNTYRNPVLLAKQASTVDILSGGRVVLGLGTGWSEREHRMLGMELPGPRELSDRLEEACQVIRALTTSTEPVDHKGRYYAMDGGALAPPPVQQPMPLMVGGAGEKRTMRTAVRYADEWNSWGTPETMAKKAPVLDQWCEAEGRDPKTLWRSCQAILRMVDTEEEAAERRAAAAGRPGPETNIGTPAQLAELMQAYVDAGVDEVIIPDLGLRSGSERAEKLDRFLTEVAASFRDTAAR